MFILSALDCRYGACLFGWLVLFFETEFLRSFGVCPGTSSCRPSCLPSPPGRYGAINSCLDFFTVRSSNLELYIRQINPLFPKLLFVRILYQYSRNKTRIPGAAQAPIGSGTIRRCDLVGGSVSLWRWVLRSCMLKLYPVCEPVASVACGSRCRTLSSFSSTMSACMPL